MKAKIGKQQAAYNAVKRYRDEHPEANLKDAIAAVAKKTRSTTGSVHAAYYTHARRNGDALKARTPRATATKTAPPKKPVTTKIKKTKQQNASHRLDLNVLRVSLSDAIKTIDALEAENKKNREIIDTFRTLVNA